jgi:tRNA pseudouridine32 synthase / 23S rRNA pseudouridine746 synthase
MQEVEGSPNSFTRIEVLARGEDRWLYGLQPETGKTHQLRLHMLGLGMPILNDLLYPIVHPVGGEDFSRPLQLLARRLRFIDPVSGEERCFESRLQLQQCPACNSSSRSPAVVAK